jgi:mannose-6-phosphate isomerase-like protein (cupin superfamily)
MKDRMHILEPSCNLDTVKDGRGAIYSFLPNEPIVEWTYQFIKSGKVRGNHSHPEFNEYILLVAGNGVEVGEGPDGSETKLFMSKGTCIYIPRGTDHVFLAITDCESVSFLTKRWEDCERPIIHRNLGFGSGDHGDPKSPFFKS